MEFRKSCRRTRIEDPTSDSDISSPMSRTPLRRLPSHSFKQETISDVSESDSENSDMKVMAHMSKNLVKNERQRNVLFKTEIGPFQLAFSG